MVGPHLWIFDAAAAASSSSPSSVVLGGAARRRDSSRGRGLEARRRAAARPEGPAVPEPHRGPAQSRRACVRLIKSSDTSCPTVAIFKADGAAAVNERAGCGKERCRADRVRAALSAARGQGLAFLRRADDNEQQPPVPGGPQLEGALLFVACCDLGLIRSPRGGCKPTSSGFWQRAVVVRRRGGADCGGVASPPPSILLRC